MKAEAMAVSGERSGEGTGLCLLRSGGWWFCSAVPVSEGWERDVVVGGFDGWGGWWWRAAVAVVLVA